ncbi:type 2 lanthipeptide synthetase LanM family protein [Xylanibacillus composti]|uniref:Lanthionine synthetase n=1 Tax=Xylanibacillus composti TaxID=1572762 RepID=A0A8J4H3Y0_9BACL|nr:type 2 lanthipeptide synthetase LanM family protein [Xylanibacillus composti]GIQ69116.1 lanthionine synthetase [Xylanibacillus composti]
MSSSIVYNALHLQERKSFGPARAESDLTEVLPYWRQLLDCESEQSFEALLARHYQIDLPFLRRHFRENADGTGGGSKAENLQSDWVAYMKEVLIKRSEGLNPGSSTNVKERSPLLHDYEQVMEGTSLSDFPFYTIYEPLVQEFYTDLFVGEGAAPEMVVRRLAKHDLIQYYLDLLYAITHKTLMLEINCLRLEGKLEGESPEQRYEHYVSQFLRNRHYLSNLLEEYPVMFRLIAEKTGNLKRFIREILGHAHQDWHALQQRFSVREPDIVRLQLGKGDSHKKGRTVAILQFGCGTKLVYKPRSMGIDDTFQQFLQWMNERLDDGLPLCTAGVWNRQTYGWMEYISYAPCASDEERQRFYYRLGKLLAVLHTMNATDFHYENIIASTDQPVLVDLESLFQHTVSKDHDYTGSGAINRALTLIRDSVLSTGVVPTNIDREQSFDISGVGGIGEQQSPFQIQTVEGKHTDEIRLVKRLGKLESGHNNPLAGQQDNGASREIMHYMDFLLDGFQAGYRLFLIHKPEAVRQLEAFGNCEVRKILKSTMIYSKLLHLSYHPDFLRNQLDREMLLNRISLASDDLDRRIVLAEIADLLDGDIPYFSAIPSGTWMRDARNQSIDGFFYEDGLTRSLRKLDQLSAIDLEHQLNIIQATIAAVYAKEDIKLIRLDNWKATEAEQVNLLHKAEIIADTVIRAAIKHEGEQGLEYCWTSMVTKGGRKHVWQYSVTGPGIYDGNPGIALLFAQLWRLTGKERYREACLAAIRPIQLILEELVQPDNINLGAFLGIGGMAYGFAQLGAVLKDAEMKQCSDRLLREIPRLVHQDRLYDLIGGSAGALAVIASVLEQNPESAWLIEIGEKLVSHLIQHAVPMESGVAWTPANSPERPYIGFSHGNAGIIFALCRFMTWSRQQAAIKKTVQEALDYENRFYDPAVRNWFSVHLNKHSIAWCHGAPGILLSRMEAVRCGIAHEQLERDRQAALATTLDVSLGGNFSFCHGNFGNFDVLVLAAPYASMQEQAQIEAKKHAMLDELFRRSDVIHADINAIGVMNGLASIGYGLLRIHDPQDVPSLLTLELKGQEAMAGQANQRVG